MNRPVYPCLRTDWGEDGRVDDSQDIRPSAKRDHLVETAWRLFYRDGFRAVGIDTILAEAGVAKMTLYKHFASKEDLIVTVLQRRHHDFLESLAAALRAAPAAGEERLLTAFDWLAAWLEGRDFNGCAFIRAVGEFPAATERPHQVAAAHKQAVIDVLTAEAAAAGLPDPDELGRELALVMEGAIVTAHTHGATGVGPRAKTTARRLIAGAKAAAA